MLTKKEKIKKSLFPFWEAESEDFTYMRGLEGADVEKDDEVSSVDASRNAHQEFESCRIEVMWGF